MELVRAGEAVTSTLGRLYKFHGHILAPGDEDIKSATMEAFVKTSKELVTQASVKLSIMDIQTLVLTIRRECRRRRGKRLV